MNTEIKILVKNQACWQKMEPYSRGRPHPSSQTHSLTQNIPLYSALVWEHQEPINLKSFSCPSYFFPPPQHESHLLAWVRSVIIWDTPAQFNRRLKWGHIKPLIISGRLHPFSVHELNKSLQTFAVLLNTWAMAGCIRWCMRDPLWWNISALICF